MKKLDEEGRRRRQRNLPRKSLLDPKDSPWAKVYESGDDSALITVTGFDHATFQFMLALLSHSFSSTLLGRVAKTVSSIKESSMRKEEREQEERERLHVSLFLDWFLPGIVSVALNLYCKVGLDLLEAPLMCGFDLVEEC